MSVSIADWRADTPGCAHRNHLNNAGAALMPQPVIDAITDHVRLESEIGGYEAADARADEIARGYEALAEIVGRDAREHRRRWQTRPPGSSRRSARSTSCPAT